MQARPTRIAKAETGPTAVDYFMIATLHGIMLLGVVGAVLGAVGTVANTLKFIW